MLKQISIENFKSFIDKTDISLSDITVLSGKNSSGKSSLYQPLVCLAQSAKDNSAVAAFGSILPVFNTYGRYLNLGAPEELIPEKRKKLTLELKYDSSTVQFRYKLVKGNLILTDQFWGTNSDSDPSAIEEGYAFNFNPSTGAITITGERCFSFRNYFGFRLDKLIQEKLSANPKKNEQLLITGDFYRHYIKLRHVNKAFFYHSCLEYITLPYEALKSIIKREVLQQINFDSDFLPEVKNIFKDEPEFDLIVASNFTDNVESFDRIVSISPFRGNPKRYYDYIRDKDTIFQFKPASNNHFKVKYNIDESGNFVEKPLKEAVRFWCNRILGVDGVNVKDRIKNVSAEILIKDGNKEYPINTVGFGLGQSIPIIIQLLAQIDGFLFIVDEPEIHLHPQAQIAFAEFLRTMAKLGKQIIVETHSEYMINKFILESLKDKKPAIGLFWVNKNGDSSSIAEIEYDDLGFISNRPQGFSDGMEAITDSMLDLRMEKL